VNNPSYLNVDLPKISAQIFYPINNTRIGNGTISNTHLPSNSNRNFTFPFNIIYTLDIDPDKAIIKDLVSKCLGNGGDLTVRYDLTVSSIDLFLLHLLTKKREFVFDRLV
jgi:hypothetical protein